MPRQKLTQSETTRWAQALPSAGVPRGLHGAPTVRPPFGVWPDTQAEVSLKEAAAGLWLVCFPETRLCHAHIYMTPEPLSSEHAFEKEKFGSGSPHPSEVSKDFPFPKPFPLNLAKIFLPG